MRMSAKADLKPINSVHLHDSTGRHAKREAITKKSPLTDPWVDKCDQYALQFEDKKCYEFILDSGGTCFCVRNPHLVDKTYGADHIRQ